MKKVLILHLILVISLLTLCNVRGQKSSDPKISGTIFFTDETYLFFDDLQYIHGFIANTSRFNKYKAIKISYRNSIRIIAVSELKYLKVESFNPAILPKGKRVIRNVYIKMETKDRMVLGMKYFELDWVLVKIYNRKDNKYDDRIIPFNRNGILHIKKIIFD